jgi:DNA-binding NtrC family response regulator
MDSPQKRILIVDDEPPLLKMMGVYLTRKGFTVTTLASTDQAWVTVNESAGEVDAVVIDGSMRGLSAEELGLRILKANPAACVLMTSGYPVDMGRLEEAGPGRVGFVQKPFTAETLAGTLRRMIAAQEEDV